MIAPVEVTKTTEIIEIEEKALKLYESTKEVTISNQQEYDGEGMRLMDIKKRYKEIDGKRKELVRPFQDATKRLNEFFKKPLEWYKSAEVNIKTAILKYEREREEEQRKLEEEVEKKRQKLEKRAERYQEKGNGGKAEELLREAVGVSLVTKPVEKVAGISKRDNWKYCIKDVSQIPREYMIPDEKRLGQIAKASKGLVKIPGVLFYNDPIIASKVAE